MIFHHNFDELKSIVEQYYAHAGDYKLINELLENKSAIDAVYNHAGKVCEAIQQSFPQLHTKIERNRTFPSIAITTILNMGKQPERAFSHSIKMKISLLAPYFTIYHEESIIASKDLHILGQPVWVNLLSQTDSVQDPDGQIVKVMHEAVQQCFPDYKFAKHVFLLNRKVEQSIPYTSPAGFFHLENKEYSLFDLLFDNEYCIHSRKATAF